MEKQKIQCSGTTRSNKRCSRNGYANSNVDLLPVDQQSRSLSEEGDQEVKYWCPSHLEGKEIKTSVSIKTCNGLTKKNLKCMRKGNPNVGDLYYCGTHIDQGSNSSNSDEGNDSVESYRLSNEHNVKNEKTEKNNINSPIVESGKGKGKSKKPIAKSNKTVDLTLQCIGRDKDADNNIIRCKERGLSDEAYACETHKLQVFEYQRCPGITKKGIRCRQTGRTQTKEDTTKNETNDDTTIDSSTLPIITPYKCVRHR